MALLVLIRVLLSVTANTLQKRLVLGGLRIVPMWLVTYLLMLVPGILIAASRSTAMPAAFWINVMLGGVLDALGNLAMVAALRSTDLSVFGPLNAFRPVLALLFGWVFLGEAPTAAGGFGILIIMGGTIVLFGGPAEWKWSTLKPAMRTLAFRLTGMTLSTVGAVYLKRAATVGSVELTLAVWIACGLAGLLAVSLGRGSRPVAEMREGLRQHGMWLVWHAGLFFIMQWATIRIFQHTLLAYSFAFFQLGMALQVLTGWICFQEPAVGRRLAGCVVMCLGSALVAWKG